MTGLSQAAPSLSLTSPGGCSVAPFVIKPFWLVGGGPLVVACSAIFYVFLRLSRQRNHWGGASTNAMSSDEETGTRRTANLSLAIKCTDNDLLGPMLSSGPARILTRPNNHRCGAEQPPGDVNLHAGPCPL